MEDESVWMYEFYEKANPRWSGDHSRIHTWGRLMYDGAANEVVQRTCAVTRITERSDPKRDHGGLQEWR